jgi:hypothetical protein
MNPVVWRGAHQTNWRLKDSIEAVRCMPFPHSEQAKDATGVISGQTRSDRCRVLSSPGRSIVKEGFMRITKRKADKT